MKKWPLFLFVLLYLFCLFFNLWARDLFGVEGRWAEAAREMALRGSNFVPTLNFSPHITKPLLPFWLIKASGLIFGFNEFAVRFPSAILSILTLVAFYFLTKPLLEERLRLLALFIFGSTLGFMEFSRLAQSEIYQLFGVVLALAFYTNFREKTSLLGYAGFFTGLLFGGLSKGLTTPAILFIAVLLDILLGKRFYHFNFKLFSVLLLSLFLYFLPYYLTAKALESPLPFYLFLRENLTQAVDPYDNLRPFYIYLYYYPLWVAPYSLLLLAGLFYYLKNFQPANQEVKWILLANLAVLVLFMLAKARRGYYLLPILPLAVLLILHFLKEKGEKIQGLLRLHQFLLFFLFLMLTLLPLILKLLHYPLEETFLLAYFFLLGLSFFILWAYLKKRLSLYEDLALLTLCLYALYYPFLKYTYSYPSEKLAGTFVQEIISWKTGGKAPTVCYAKEKDKPTANFFFYAKIMDQVKEVKLSPLDLKDCPILIVREGLTQEEEKLLRDLKYTKKQSFVHREKSKTYEIYFQQSSEALKTPSR